MKNRRWFTAASVVSLTLLLVACETPASDADRDRVASSLDASNITRNGSAIDFDLPSGGCRGNLSMPYTDENVELRISNKDGVVVLFLVTPPGDFSNVRNSASVRHCYPE